MNICGFVFVWMGCGWGAGMKSCETLLITLERERILQRFDRSKPDLVTFTHLTYSSFVPSPETFLHRVDARVKQVSVNCRLLLSVKFQ